MKYEDVKVEQRVRYVGGEKELKGQIGICKGIKNPHMIAIQFLDWMGGHDCFGCCKAHSGWWCAREELEIIEDTTGASNDQVDVHIARLEDVVETFFTIGVSRQDMLELFNDISKKHFSEKQLRDRIAKIKDKVRRCQN